MTPMLAIVTGATSGIGACVARRCLERGMTVWGVGRRPGQVEGDGYHHGIVDLSDVAATREHFEKVMASRFPPDAFARLGLVNNAGTVEPALPLHQVDPLELLRAVVLQSIVPAWLMGFAVRHAAGRPVRIVNLSTGAAQNPYPGWGAYCIGKAGLRMASQVMAVEAEEVPDLAGRDVAVVSYAPGVVDTAMQDVVRSARPQDFPRLQRFIDLKREGKLVDPVLPAAEIVALLERDDLPRFSETRYQG